MAYGEKYYHSYCNSFGTPCKVSILQVDYEGVATECEAQSVPFTKAYDADNKYKPIRPSVGEVNFIFGTDNLVDFDEIWTADEREFKVIHYIDGNIDWVGYIIPNGFEYPLTGGPYQVTITASDGLSTLADIDFVFDSGENYGAQDLTYNNGFEFPFVLIATEILRKLDLDLNLWTCIDIYEQNMTSTGDTRDADPLATSYANVKTYIEDSDRKDIPYWKDANEAMNCKKVMENLCTMFHASVYQSKGVWRIKRWAADQDYGTGPTQRYWRKYNTLAVYLPGYETINDEITIPCSTISKAMIGDNHLMYMDEVFSAFRMNYKFQLKREGDEPEVLLKNGDFEIFTSQTDKMDAPNNWFRWHYKNEWAQQLKRIDVTGEIPNTELTKAIVMGQQPSGVSSSNLDNEIRPWNSLRYSDIIPLTKSDLLYFRGWIKIKLSYNAQAFTAAIFGISLIGDTGAVYRLINYNSTGVDKDAKGSQWLKIDDSGNIDANINTIFGSSAFQITTYMFDDYSTSNGDQFIWRHFALELPALPETGGLVFEVFGQSNTVSKKAKKRFLVRNTFNNKETYVYELYSGVRGDTKIPYMQIAGLEIGRIKDPNEYAEEQDYLYYNEGKYSLEVEPLEVLNGDVLDPSHTSRIIVPDNNTDSKNFWDLIDGSFGYSSLGLVAVKSIMSLYYKPFRLIDGAIKAENITIDTRFTFEALPGITFGLMRGTFNEKDNYLEDATFFQLGTNDIPAGGIEGGTDLDPRPTPTGRIRCIKESGVNTGRTEFEIIDSNSNSESYGVTDWFASIYDYDMCPIGEPTYYYWGTDVAGYNENNFVSETFYVDDDDDKRITVSYTNPGNQYIFFVHLSSLGTVEGVETDQQSNVISDFQYLTDLVIDGYTYRVLRQNYVTAEFIDFNITYIFS